jgi:hypothetical protein
VSRYPLGAPIRQSTTTRQLNIDGTYSLVNATTLTLTVQKPDATQQVYSSPVNDGTGLYHVDIPASDLTQLGHYQIVWTSTGTAAGVQPSDFDVFDPFEAALLPLQDAQDALNEPVLTPAQAAELQAYIATIETSLEGMTGGPLMNRVVTERGELDGTCTVLQVQQRPLVSVTSITPVATGIAADLSAGLDLDKSAGIIRAIGGTLAGQWNSAVTTVYVAGWGTAIPAAFNIAGRIILAHLWETQHGPSARPSMGGQDTVLLPGWGFAIPRRAAELLNGSQGGIPFRLEVFA